MDPSKFVNPATGERLKLGPEGWAFLPAPLPPRDLELDWETIRLYGEARAALGELNGIGQMIPNPALLISSFLRKEAVLSSRIEGSIATERDVALFEAGAVEEERVESDSQEVLNYMRAVRQGKARLSELPISLRLLRELHETLLAGVRGEDKRPGRFRDVPIMIGSRGDSMATARFVPPPPQHIATALDHLEKYIHSDDNLPDLVRVALVHYQFETIHPFHDGNGRIGRLLIVLQMLDLGILSQPLLYLSAYLDRRREEYVDHLLQVSQAGTWKEWIDFFLEGLREQASDASLRAKALLALRDSYHRRLQEARASAKVLQLADYLFEVPVLTPARAAEVLGLSYNATRNTIDRLVEHGMLTPLETDWRKVYIAREIFDVMEPARTIASVVFETS